MKQLQLKFKVIISLEELRELREAIENFLSDYENLSIDTDKEREIYRLSDLHILFYSWINPKLNSLEKSGRSGGRYEILYTHILTLWHILQRVPISRLLQRNFLAQIDRIKQEGEPIFQPQKAANGGVLFICPRKPLFEEAQ